MTLTTYTPRGEIVANEQKKIRVKIVSGVVGEDGKTWLSGTVHNATEPFALELIRRKKAVEAGAKDAK